MTGKRVRSSDELLEASEDILKPFKATVPQKKAKASFWVAYSDNPLTPVDDMTTAEIARYIPGTSVDKWMHISGFRDWFFNKNEHRQRLEYLYNLALDSAESILLDDDPKTASARVNVIKVIAELANKYPRQNESSNRYLDSTIASMDRAELEMFLEKQGVQMHLTASRGSLNSTVQVPKVLDIIAEEDIDGSD